MKKKAFLLVTILLASCSALVGQRPHVSVQSPADILSQSYSLLEQVKAADRLYYFDDLAKASSEMTPHPVKTEEWCNTLFVMASQTQDPRVRESGKKNALMYLSSVNPVSALGRLREVQLPPAPAGELRNEDIRADAADKIFQNLLDRAGIKSLSDIEDTARFLGKTGQYPYRAVATLLGRFSTEEARSAANGLFGDALAFYTQETGFQNREEEFLSLLTSDGLHRVDQQLVVPALHLFIDRILKQSADERVHYYAQVFVPGGTVVPFSDRNRAFLFLVTPAVRRFDHDFADDLGRRYPELKEASTTNKMYYISGGLFFGNPAEAGKSHIKWLQQSLVDKIRELDDADPDTTFRMASLLIDRSMRISGLSAAASGLARTNGTLAATIYEEQVAEAQNLTGLEDKLTATVALAQVAHSLGKSGDFAQLSHQALDLGQKVLGQDSRSVRIQRLKGYNGLTQIVRLGAEAGVDLVPSVTQTSRPDLKAYLLIAKAEGDAKRNHSGGVSTAKK